MFEAKNEFVFRNQAVFCVCYEGTRDEAASDARELAAMLNAQGLTRTPHPATELRFVGDVEDANAMAEPC